MGSQLELKLIILVFIDKVNYSIQCLLFSGCLGMWCLPCLGCMVAKQLGEHCCVPTCVHGGFMGLRVKARTVMGIEVRYHKPTQSYK